MQVLIVQQFGGLAMVHFLHLRHQRLIKHDGKIHVQTQEEGKPMSHLVHCYHARTGERVGSKWSDDDGNVTFDNLIKGVKYFVVMVDRVTDQTHYAPVGQDWLVAQ